MWSALSAFTLTLVYVGLSPGLLPFLLRDPSDYTLARLSQLFGGGAGPRFVFGLIYWVGTIVLLALAIRGKRIAAAGGAILLAGFTLPALALDISFLGAPIYWLVGLMNVFAFVFALRIAFSPEGRQN